MIGKNIRGLRHLLRVVGNLEFETVLFRHRDYGLTIGKAISVKLKNEELEYLFIFNNRFNSMDSSFMLRVDIDACEDVQKKIKAVSSQYHKLFVLQKNKDIIHTYTWNDILQNIVLLPRDFDENFTKFLIENKKIFVQLHKKYGIDKDTYQIKLLYCFSNGSKNFVQWGVNAWLNSQVSILTLKNILQWNDNYAQLVKKLSKGTITAYTSQNDVWKLLDEIRALTKEKRVNDAINSFNTEQKKLLRQADKTETDINTLAAFANLSETKRINFIRKVSTINDYNELMKQMRFVTSTHFEWDKQSFMDYLNNVDNLQYSLIYEKNDIVLVEVKDFDTVKRLAKMTNWCISKNKTYWNQYTKEGKVHKGTQYMLFNFSKKEDDNFSIVGFTTLKNKGITNAHDYVNHNLMRKRTKVFHSQLTSYLEKMDDDISIFSLLDSYNIDISLFVKFDKPKYPWNPIETLNYLYTFIPKDEVTILRNSENKLAVSVTDEAIADFLGYVYKENIPSDYYDWQHLLFFDFNKKSYDPNKLQFAIIHYQHDSEDECIALYNEKCEQVASDCDEKLVEFQLPYTIIRRIDDIHKRFTKDFINLKYKRVKEFLAKDKTLLNVAIQKRYIDKSNIFRVIRNSITNYMSFDYLNLMYSLYPNLSSLIGTDYVKSLADNLLAYIINGKIAEENTNKISLNLPTEQEIKDFYDKSINSTEKILRIGASLALETVLNNEKSTNGFDDIMFTLLKNIDNHKTNGTLCKWLVDLFLENCNLALTNKSDTKRIIDYIAVYCIDKKDKVLACLPKDSSIYQFAEQLFSMSDKIENATYTTSVEFTTNEPYQIEWNDLIAEPINIAHRV